MIYMYQSTYLGTYLQRLSINIANCRHTLVGQFRNITKETAARWRI